jgi:hypothetical protein
MRAKMHGHGIFPQLIPDKPSDTQLSLQRCEMPFGAKKGGGNVGALSKKNAIESQGEKTFKAALASYKHTPELHMAVRGDAAWGELVRERRWWRRISLCKRVGHCTAAKKNPLCFLPIPGDVRVCAYRRVSPTTYSLLEWGDWFEEVRYACRSLPHAHKRACSMYTHDMLAA